ncbi:CocE/NonD family hydrolase [Mycolicibacterium sp. 018/SC-01/001]|uniref:CocE/NonD family hydrolase n=1 Tax=Mycolicibacterium sp. 018/SC-01/001 TaxID=2592069 RepID=UPI00351A4D79
MAVALGIGAAVLAGAGVAAADEGSDSGSSTGGSSASTGQTSHAPSASEAPRKESKTRRPLFSKPAAQNADSEKPDADTRPVRKRHTLSVTASPNRGGKGSDSTLSEKAEEAVTEPDVAEPPAGPAISDVPAIVHRPFWPKKPEPVGDEPEVALPDAQPPARTLTPLLDRIAAKRADANAGDDPALPALASLVMSVVTAGREVTTETPDAVGSALATTSQADSYPIPEGVTVEEVHPPLFWLQRIPVLGTFVVTPIVRALHALPLVGDALQPIIGFPLNRFDPPGTPQPKSYWVTSFDGTRIFVNVMPSLTFDELGQAPTVLDGPGLGLPGSTSLALQKDSLLPFDVIGIGRLREAGYNVVTWDPRGEWRSGGILTIDSPDYEGRDMSSIISFLSTLPYVKLDGENDPRIGMVGASYGGGIQLATAAIDHRVDAIVPTIAWNDLVDVLFPRGAVNSAWGTLLPAVLVLTLAREHPRILPVAVMGVLFGIAKQSDIDLVESLGFADQIKDITAPTLLIQGTVDTLFPLSQADANATALLDAGTTTKVIWYCGGHGACLTQPKRGEVILDRTMDWLNHYVMGDENVSTGPGFEWTDQNGVWYSSEKYPADNGEPIVATENKPKTIPYIPFLGGSGPDPRILFHGPLQTLLGIASGGPALNAVNLKVPPVQELTHIVGAPELTLTYSGKGNAKHVYAQIVDDKTGIVLGTQVTPIPVTLDGATHQVTFSLEDVAHTLQPGQSVTVQVVTSAIKFLNFYSWGRITVEGMTIKLPTLASDAQQEPIPA